MKILKLLAWKWTIFKNLYLILQDSTRNDAACGCLAAHILEYHVKTGILNIRELSVEVLIFKKNFFFKPNYLFQSWAMEMQSVWVFYLFLPPSWICHTKSELDSVPSRVRLKYTKFTSASRQAAPQDCPETARMLSMEKSAVPKARRTLKPRSCPALAHGVLPAGLWTEQELFACVCVRAFVYGLGHCFHFRRNKINPFDILALSLLGSNWWWIIQIWQRVLSALKLHFSTFAGKICQL